MKKDVDALLAMQAPDEQERRLGCRLRAKATGRSLDGQCFDLAPDAPATDGRVRSFAVDPGGWVKPDVTAGVPSRPRSERASDLRGESSSEKRP